MGKTVRATPEKPKKPSVIERATNAVKAFDKRVMGSMPDDFKRMHSKPKKKG